MHADAAVDRPPEARVLARIFLFMLTAWPILMVASAVAWSRSPFLGLTASLATAWVQVQLGFFYHELWHNQLFARPATNRFCYGLVSLCLFSNPQIYGIAHASHHQHVHTWQDLEFYPRGKPSSPLRARIQFLLELCFGQIAWVLHIAPVIHSHPRHDLRTTLRFLGMFALSQLALIAAVAAFTDWYWLPVAYFASLVLSSAPLRWLQFAEHLGIVAPEGTGLDARNAMTRNVATGGLMAGLWHSITANDSASHVDHHLVPGTPNRWPLPTASLAGTRSGRTVAVGEFPGIVAEFWRDPLRITEPGTGTGTAHESAGSDPAA